MKSVIVGKTYQRGRWPWSLWRLYAADSRNMTVELEHKFIKNVFWMGTWDEFEKTFK
jgi:hypothetical protein